jgi:hypothetical protein
LVNTGGVIDGLPGYGGDTGPIEPKFSRFGGYSQNLSDFRDSQTFHKFIFPENLKKVNLFKLHVLTNLQLNCSTLLSSIEELDMVKKKLLGERDMAAMDSRIAKMGREFYQFMEDYPAPPDWSYTEFFMFIHQLIYDEAMKLKKAAVATERSLPSGRKTVQFELTKFGELKNQAVIGGLA